MTIQIFVDSVNVINWFEGNQICQNLLLLALLEEVFHLKEYFDNCFCRHVYRERNGDVNHLSKEGIFLDFEYWLTSELLEDAFLVLSSSIYRGHGHK